MHPIEDSKQLRIEQVRELAQELSLTSHQGGYKVGILSPADSLNRFAANALLKTLEEPPARTLLILVASQPSRLPATILSRCQRLRVRAPHAGRKRSNGCSRREGPGTGTACWTCSAKRHSWPPRRDPKAIPRSGAETRRTLEELAAGSADPVATAERWSRSEPALRLRCFENWLTDRIRAPCRAAGRLAVEIRRSAHLPRGAGHEYTRALRAGRRRAGLRSTLDVPINRSLALEALLRRLAG